MKTTPINQELLRSFVCVAESDTFAQAAKLRRVTKSAVSQQIKTLETQLGIALFERVGRHARLTDSGRQLADVLRRQFVVIDDALEAVASVHSEVCGEVRIGSPRPFAQVWLRGRLAALLRQHEGLRATVVFGTPTELERRLSQRALDLAILVRDPEQLGVEARPIFTEHFFAYGAPAYLHARPIPQTAPDFADHRFIVFDEDFPMHDSWWRCWFGPRVDFQGTIVCRVESLPEMLGLAEEGIGLVVLPDYFAEDSVRRGSLVKLSAPLKRPDAVATNQISLAWRRNTIETARFRAARMALLR